MERDVLPDYYGVLLNVPGTFELGFGASGVGVCQGSKF